MCLCCVSVLGLWDSSQRSVWPRRAKIVMKCWKEEICLCSPTTGLVLTVCVVSLRLTGNKGSGVKQKMKCVGLLNLVLSHREISGSSLNIQPACIHCRDIKGQAVRWTQKPTMFIWSPLMKKGRSADHTCSFPAIQCCCFELLTLSNWPQNPQSIFKHETLIVFARRNMCH